jgi:predicted rRNA methylase YqxC with S4 and FtsJ domains
MKLKEFLVNQGIAASRSQASLLIQSGQVQVNGLVVTNALHKLIPGDRVTYGSNTFIVP